MSQLLSSIISFGPQPNKAIVGENAVAHEAGIHQNCYLKERTTYEIMEPQSVGVPESRLVLGKHSGRHALSQRCADLGVELNKEQLDVMYDRFHGGGGSQEGSAERRDCVAGEGRCGAVEESGGEVNWDAAILGRRSLQPWQS